MESESQLSRRARAFLGAPALALLLVACGSGETEVASSETTEPTTSISDVVQDDAVQEEAQQDDGTSETVASAGSEAPEDDGSATTDAASTGTDAAADSGRPAIQVLSADEAIANAEANIGNLQLADSPFDVEVLAVGDGSVQTVRDVVTGDRPVLLWFFSPH